ncbi:MAG: Ty1/Copia family ribonuclease HI, partial [Planctomycetota bacterium]|nr:Ty1/Copia family ribonuclease HI [Planctomycetota bacterium]
MEWDMQDQINQTIELYRELLDDPEKPLRKCSTPFRSAKVKGGIAKPVTTGPWLKCPWCKGCFDERTFDKGSGDPEKVERQASKKLLEDKDIREADPRLCKLGEKAMRVLMKLLYAARIARPDLLRAINALGAWIHKWDEECEADLHRLMCYLWSSPERRQYAWVGDPKEAISAHLFADADFAGDHKGARSTTGVHLCLRGPNTYCPLSGISKKQEAVSHSTPEAEIVAAAFAIRREGLPSSYIWNLLLKEGEHPATAAKCTTSPPSPKSKSGAKVSSGAEAVKTDSEPVTVIFHEDNQTMIRVCETGRNPTMRHLGRTHFVQVAWLKERFQSPDLKLIYEKSAKQAADICTKGFDNA